MGRGADKYTQRLAAQQLAQQNAMIGQEAAQRDQLNQLLLPQVQSLLASQGYSPAEQSAITQQSMGALGSAFDALRERAANRLAATGASAGYPELLDELSREQGRQAAGQAQQNQIAFAAEKQRRQLEGLQALGNLYGIDTNLLGRAMGVAPEILSASAQAGRPNYGYLGGLAAGAGAGLGSLFG